MKKLSITKMSDTIISKRKEAKMTQVQLAEATGINRGMISRLEAVIIHLLLISYNPSQKYFILK